MRRTIGPYNPGKEKRAIRVIAIVNQKGGAGKTNVAVNLSAELAARGRRVLFVDLDRQATASVWFLGYAPRQLDVGALMTQEAFDRAPQAIAELGETWSKLHVLPAREETLGAAAQKISADASYVSLLGELLAQQEAHYDYVILDCPPNLEHIVQAAIFAATDVIIPVNGTEALDGLVQIEALMRRMRKTYGSRAELLGVLCTMYRAGIEHFDKVLTALEDPALRAFRTRIRLAVAAAELHAHQLPARVHKPKSPAAIDYRRLAKEVEERCA